MKGEARRIELDQVAVKSPCPMKWAELEGDGERRFCRECSLHVVNLSAMTRTAAQGLLDERAGDERVCVTFTRRADGSLVTADREPARIRRGGRWRILARLAASLLFGLSPLLAACRPGVRDGGENGPDVDPASTGGGDPICTQLTGEVALPEPDPSLELSVPETVLGRLAVPVDPPEPRPSE